MIYSFVFGVIFIIAGLMFISGKALRFIKGWQMTPQEEKDKIRIRPLCRNFGTLLTAAGLAFLAAGCLPDFRENMFRWVMIGWLVLCGLDVVYVNKSKRYIVTK